MNTPKIIGMSPKVTIGTDPELFIKNSKTGAYVSSHDLIPGTKMTPFFVQKGAVQVDGVAAEFNTFPASTADEFISNIETVRGIMLGMIQEKNPDLTLVANPTATFDPEYFWNLPEDVLALGCTPDYNAYLKEENTPPWTEETFRTGSGHIHVGWTDTDPNDEDHFEMCCDLVRQLDCVLYPVSLLWDSDDKRRSLYGKIGAFRPKFFGVEYRPLSNAYLRSNDTIRWVFDSTVKAAEMFFEGKRLYESAYLSGIVQDIRDNKLMTWEMVQDVHDYLAFEMKFPNYLDTVRIDNEAAA